MGPPLDLYTRQLSSAGILNRSFHINRINRPDIGGININSPSPLILLIKGFG
jgi:hypothetical protein